MVEIRRLAEELLDFLHKEDEKRGRSNIAIATLYKAFEKEAPYDAIQRAIRYLVDRDLIAPSSYSLTAKGRREHGLSRKN
jgi:uncharacterized membrane-anchored protein YjiN (DUF445 family)